jgi:ABC-type Zn uptake system ZnuABC Zn-binding protein ZnuA
MSDLIFELLKIIDSVDIERKSRQPAKSLEIGVTNFVADKYPDGMTSKELEPFIEQMKAKANKLTDDLNELVRRKAITSVRKVNYAKRNQQEQEYLNEELLVADAARELEMTARNLNHLIKSHNLKVREVSKRKRYIKRSEMKKIGEIKYRKK